MGLPTIYETPADYSSETARTYDEKASEEVKKEEENQEVVEQTQEELQQTQEEIESLQFLHTSSNTIKQAIYQEKLTESPYQFTKEESYTNTNFSDKTDTYINMNTSFRYIKYNLGGAGNLYNKLSEGNNFRTDSPKKVFESLKNRFVTLGFNKKTNDQGKLETFEIQNDTDMLYVIGFFQTFLKDKLQDASNIDFRVGPKTLGALVDDKNKLEYTEAKPEEVIPAEEIIEEKPEEESEENILEENTEETITNENENDTENQNQNQETTPPILIEEETQEDTEDTEKPIKILDNDFKDGLQQDLDIQTKVTNIDKLINEYPDIASLIQSMKNIDIDYETAKNEKNEIDINRVIALLKEIEHRNVADMQEMIDMVIKMKLSKEKAVKFIIFYKALERKEVINPEITNINALRKNYGYTQDKDIIAQAEYEDNLLDFYTMQTENEKKYIIVKEYTRTILEKTLTEKNNIRTTNQGKVYAINKLNVGIFYSEKSNQLFVNYIDAGKLPRKNDFQTVIFNKEDFLNQEKSKTTDVTNTKEGVTTNNNQEEIVF